MELGKQITTIGEFNFCDDERFIIILDKPYEKSRGLIEGFSFRHLKQIIEQKKLYKVPEVKK